MALGLQLSQRLTQSMVLAPQLQQSLALLQAPTLELKALIEQELEQNPVLEEVAAPELELPEKPVTDFADTADTLAPPDPAERADAARRAFGLADEAEDFERDDRQHARHDVQNQSADEGVEQHLPERLRRRRRICD